ncbi:DUF4145 domain-containing protein [Escherichia coli]|nr:DUF4145 domain-containing protein [Escherichia coli]
MPVLVWFSCQYSQLKQIKSAEKNSEWRFTGEPQLLGTYPKLIEPDDSPFYPEKLRPVFVELQEDVLANRTPARIITGCRSVMEVALRALGYESGNLLSRIEKARCDGILTESMKCWAHKIRLDGNEAVHELDASDHEAREFVSFLRLFLEVSFILPARVEREISKN